MRYVIFDVETPNRANRRMSAIGITVLENEKVKEELYSLVNPETNFDYFNTKLTGIDSAAVRGAPTFPLLWKKIEPIMSKGVLVAHNASFDLRVLRSCLDDYDITWKPTVDYLCTVRLGKKFLPNQGHKLNELCEYYGIDLDHHHADSDSRACAEILLRYIKSEYDINSCISKYSFV